MKTTLKVAALALGMTSVSAMALDSALPTYKKSSAGVSGKISSVGSDTLANLMTFWSEEFKKTYPNVSFAIQAAGSSTAPPALTQGTSSLGPMSRAMKAKEVKAFEAKYGYKPTRVKVAIDALAVFLNKDNPVNGLPIKMVDAIFSSTSKCGLGKNITTWGQVSSSMPSAWKNRKITMYGRNSVSGTYGYFKKKALCKGDYKKSVKEQPGSSAVVQAVATNKGAIGYSGMGYTVSGVKMIALSKKGKGYVKPTPKNAIKGTYPLARFLNVYVNKKPGKKLGTNEAEFLKMVLSKQGQKIVEKDGFVALPASVAKKERMKLGL